MEDILTTLKAKSISLNAIPAFHLAENVHHQANASRALLGDTLLIQLSQVAMQNMDIVHPLKLDP